MPVLDLFYVIVPNVFRTFVIYRFISVFYEKKKRGSAFSMAACAFFFAVTAGIHIFFHNVFLNIMSNLVGMFVLTLLYESTVLKRVLLTLMIYPQIWLVTDLFS